MSRLPEIASSEEYRRLSLRDPAFAEVAREVVRRFGFAAGEVEFPATGSSPVAIVDGARVVKFFAPPFRGAAAVERAALEFLSRAANAAPAFLGSASVDDWEIVVMSRLQGKSLKDLWPEIGEDERQAACFAVGETLREIHRLPVPANLFGATLSWGEFLRKQTDACVERQSRLGLREEYVRQIPVFLASVDLVGGSSPCFLHTEIMRDHAFFARIGEKLSFSGLIDFEPSMIGVAEYDFASVGLFLSSGDPAALRAFFEGYGNLEEVDRDFRRKVMAYALLHKYSNLKWYLELMPAAESLDELAESWWAIH